MEKLGLVVKNGIIFGTISVPEEKMKRGGRVWIADYYQEDGTSIRGDFYHVKLGKSVQKKAEHYYHRTSLPTATVDTKGRICWSAWLSL